MGLHCLQVTIASGNRKQLASLVKSAVNDAASLSGDDVNYATTILDRILDAGLGTVTEQVPMTCRHLM